jgi:hypothetical protein
MPKRLRKLSKLNLETILISDDNDEAALQELAKSCLDCVLISDDNDEAALQELEAMIKEDSINSLLIENEDPIDLETLLEDIEPLGVSHQYYQKPKSKPLLTDWYI